MATPPTVTEVYEATWTSTTSPRTTGTLTVAQGDVLYVIAGGSSSNGVLTLSDSTSSAIAWTATSLTTSGYSPVYLWTATIPSGVTSLTITLTRASGSSYYGFNVFRATNCSGVGTPVTGSGTSGGPSLAITTGQSNSVIAYASSDYNSVSVTSRTWRQVNSSDPTEDYVASPSSSYYLAHYGDAGAAGSKTTGLSAPTGQKWQAIAVELKPITTVTAGLAASWDVEGTITGTLAASWDIDQLTASQSLAASWDVEQSVVASMAASWDVESVRNWRDTVRTQAFLAAAFAPHRVESARAEIVDLAGNPVQVRANDGTPLKPTLVSGTIEMSGEQQEVWSLQSATILDPRWVPRTAADPLDPRSPYAIKIWWRLKVDGAWVDVPVGVYRPSRPQVHDTGTVSISFTGRDLLSVAAAGGYGGRVVDVGGLTVDAALRRLFSVVAPTLTFVAPPTTVTLPAVYQLGARKPSEDWTEIAALAGWVVRTDAEGILTAGPQPSPDAVALSLIEGPGCLMTTIKRDISEVIYNRVVVRGTNPDLTSPVSGLAEDDDPASPTWVGRFGPYELDIDSDAVMTDAAALAMAKLNLGKYIRPTEGVSVTIPAMPWLAYRDATSILRRQAGVAGDHRLSKYTLQLPIPGKAPSLMEAVMMTRQP